MTDDITYLRGAVQLLQMEVTEIKNKLENVVYRFELEELREKIKANETKIKALEEKLGVK